MKRIISLVVVLCLIFGSFSFVFAADWSTTDSSNLQSIKNALTSSTSGTVYYMISQINAAMRFNNKTVANFLNDIYYAVDNTLWAADGNSYKGVAWWVKEAVLDLDKLVDNGSGSILNYLDSIYTKINSINSTSANIYTDVHSVKTNIGNLMEDYMPAIRNAVTLYLPSIKTDTANIYDNLGIKGYPTWYQNNPAITYYQYTGSFNSNNNFPSTSVGILGAIWVATRFASDSVAYLARDLLTGYGSSQTYTNWQSLANASFTPTSATNGLYTWLANIQKPIARLAYVHASDEEISAREKAAANTQAVVNNFVDSSGTGSVSVSDIGSLSSAAGSYKTNASTGASATGVWSVFDQSNYNWFSQTTANNLDTSANTRRAAAHYETPLLDSYYSYMTDYLMENPDD